MIIQFDYPQMEKTASSLDTNSRGLVRSLELMQQELEPLYKNWYSSGSPTGEKVQIHEGRMVEAMDVITAQLFGTSYVIDGLRKAMRQADGSLGS